MATAKITKRSVDALKAGARDVFLWDSERKGFGLKLTPAGRAIYILQYRMGGRGSPVRRYTIGGHGSPWTPDSAGKEADRLLMLVAQGVDPASEKKRQRLAAVELAFDRYADRFLEHCVKARWPRSYGFAESALRLHIKPALGTLALPSITLDDVKALLRKLPADKPGLRRNVYAVLRRLFRWAKSEGDIAVDPLDGFEAPPPVESRDRVLADWELHLLFTASEQLAPPFGAYVRLLTVLGQRRSEVASMDWSDLDRAHRVWLIPSGKAKNKAEHLVPLPALAIAELDALAGADKWPRRGLVFTTTGKTPISGFSKMKGKLDDAMLILARKDDEEAQIADWRLHDLRRSMATTMQRLRVPGDWIEACQNRLSGRAKVGAAKVYQRHDLEDEKREAMNKWAAFLDGLLAPRHNVIDITKVANV